MRKKFVIIIILILILILCGARALFVDTFPKGSFVNGVSVSNMTDTQAENVLAREANKVRVKCDSEGAKEIQAEFTYKNHEFQRLITIAAINPFTRGKLKSGDYETEMTISGGVDETAALLQKSGLSNNNRESKDAHIDFGDMKIVKESYGNKLDYTKLAHDLGKYIENGKKQDVFACESKDYVAPPKVFADDEELLAEFEFYKKYIGEGLTLSYPNGETTYIKPKKLSRIVKYNDGEMEISEEQVRKLVEKNDEYRPYSCSVKTLKGNKELPNYVLHAKVNTEKAESDIMEALKNRTQEVKLTAGESVSLPSTRVEVDLNNQHCTLVKNGEKSFTCDIVSGTSGHRTPGGIFQVAYKEKDTVLKGANDDGSEYASPVKYWMPFNGGIGLHDAGWRSSFGGSIYVNGGSHGCVNMPRKYAKKLYENIDAGTIVVVF